MPSAPHPLKRKPTSFPSTFQQSSGADETAVPCIVAALLRGQLELSLVTKAAAGLAKVKVVDDRFAVLSAIQTLGAGILVLPPFDAGRTSTAPLVLRIRREEPDVAVLLLSNHPGGAGQPLLRAAQAGARVITAPSTAELRAALSSLLEPSDPER